MKDERLSGALQAAFFVYYLLDPLTRQILYIGRSHKPLVRKGVFERRTKQAVTMGLCQRFSDFDQSCDAERRAIAAHAPPYNHKIMSARSMHGKQQSSETRAKIAQAIKGTVRSQETRDKISASRKGKPTNLGKKWSDEVRERMSLAARRREADRRSSRGH